MNCCFQLVVPTTRLVFVLAIILSTKLWNSLFSFIHTLHVLMSASTGAPSPTALSGMPKVLNRCVIRRNIPTVYTVPHWFAEHYGELFGFLVTVIADNLDRDRQPVVFV